MANKLQSYIRSPERYFASPTEVLQCSELSRQEMVTLLASWKNDLLELQHASEENMTRDTHAPGSSSAEKLSEVVEAIKILEEEPNR